MYLKNILSFACLPLALSLSAMAEEKPAAASGEPALRKLGSEKYATGMIKAEIDGGKEQEFMTTSHTIRIAESTFSKDPNVRKFQKGMNGKTIHTASLKHIAGFVFVGFDGYGNIEANGPNMNGEKATSLKISFTLDPKTLALLDKKRSIAYAAPGVSSSDSIVAADYELTLDPITKLPNGALALKGSFSGTFTEDNRGKPIDKPVAVKGTFDIQRASGDKLMINLLTK